MQTRAQRILVTGGAGFIGSHFLEQLPRHWMALVLDAFTYAGRIENLTEIHFPTENIVKGNIADRQLVRNLLSTFQPDVVVNFAAESHVDKSIAGPETFVQTNIHGVFILLEECRQYFSSLPEDRRQQFRFVQISTDEVFGALKNEAPAFTESSPYQPNSPYSASKAGGDHLVRAWHHTFGLPTLITHCSNNYGPRQFPEKLIPRMISLAVQAKPLPVYGSGMNIRDWIHVEDHCRGILLAIEKGRPGETYVFGGDSERTNLAVVEAICAEVDKKLGNHQQPSSRLIQFVEDRLGHDWRYAVNFEKAKRDLGFQLKYRSFEEGLHRTIDWYLKHQPWRDLRNEGSAA